MLKCIRKNKWVLYGLSFFIFLVLLISCFSSRVRVIEDEGYYSKREVSLYILEFGNLPDNYLTKTEAINLYGDYYSAIEAEYNIGGDIFDYRGSIIVYTDYTDLREADIYLFRETIIEDRMRGVNRLVFSSNGEEVFYTNNHYGSFSEMTLFRIQLIHYFAILLFIGYSIFIVFFYIDSFKKQTLKKDEFVEDIKGIISMYASFKFPKFIM